MLFQLTLKIFWLNKNVFQGLKILFLYKEIVLLDPKLLREKILIILQVVPCYYKQAKTDHQI